MTKLPDFASWIKQETFDPYVGGFLEVTNPYQSRIYYGEIATVTLTADGKLVVRFVWQAIGVDHMSRISREHEGGWVAYEEPYMMQLFAPANPDIPDDYVRVFFKPFKVEQGLLRVFGGPIFEDLVTFYPPGTPERVTLAEIRPADPERPVDMTPRYHSGPPGGSRTTLWDVRPDGKQVKRRL